MKRVKDDDIVQRGLYAEHKGIFVYENNSEYEQYQRRRNVMLSKKTEVEDLKVKILRLEKLVESLTEKKNG